MHASQQQILARHRASLKGKLRLERLSSDALQATKAFYVYTPPTPPVGLLYLFRGHEREYVNVKEDDTRAITTLEMLDREMQRDTFPSLIVVLPGLNSSNNHVPSLGIDMAGRWPETLQGLGTGRFWQYLSEELIPWTEHHFPVDGPRLASGFSLGGYTVSLLATGLPGYLTHAGMYDALFTWPRHHDPRVKKAGPNTDPVWLQHGIMDAALGSPRDAHALQRWNPADRILSASAQQLDKLKETTYWTMCAAGDGSAGNRQRTEAFTALLKKKRLPLGFDRAVLDAEAAHTWYWNDRFVATFLKAALNAASRGDG